MANNQSNEIWVFLSHSNKDYEKVRQVRNLLEDKSLRPLMFFLHCLNDDDEIDSLIKREIDCRTRFILCDSENARKSHWVQKEVEYIKSQNRICETIDLSKSMDEIMTRLDDFINKTKLFISYNREECKLARMVYDRLLQYDFTVYMDMYYVQEETYVQKYENTINEIHENARSGGYLISIMNERILHHHRSDSRNELIKAINDNVSYGKRIPNIIPFVTKKSLIDLIAKDDALFPLGKCGIHNLKGENIEQQCDEILRRVISQLMTPGSIKVQADNFYRGLNHREAEFLYGLLGENEKGNFLTSESGSFFVDENGIVQRFEPAEDNPFVDDVSDYQITKSSKSIRTLIIPKGVKGFVSDFMRYVRVKERFELPEGLLSIGNNTFDIKEEEHCVFANCNLPSVVIPNSVRVIGNFAFGHTHIHSLQLPASLHSPYGRQFKDSYIGTLRLPKEWRGMVALDKYNNLRLSGILNSDDFGYLRWPSTHVERLEFY